MYIQRLLFFSELGGSALMSRRMRRVKRSAWIPIYVILFFGYSKCGDGNIFLLHLQYTTFSIFVKYFGKKICFFYENVENMQNACPLQRLASALIFFCRYNYLFYFFYSFYCKGRRNRRVCLLPDCIVSLKKTLSVITRAPSPAHANDGALFRFIFLAYL